MSAVKHTPGPWVANSYGAVTRGNRGEGERLLIASVYGDDPECHPDARMGANTRLIAAAPELLEALRDALCALECCGKDYPAATKARAAIAKAVRA